MDAATGSSCSHYGCRLSLMTLSQSRPTCTSTASVSCCKQVSVPIPSAQQRGASFLSTALRPPVVDVDSRVKPISTHSLLGGEKYGGEHDEPSEVYFIFNFSSTHTHTPRASTLASVSVSPESQSQGREAHLPTLSRVVANSRLLRLVSSDDQHLNRRALESS